MGSKFTVNVRTVKDTRYFGTVFKDTDSGLHVVTGSRNICS